MERASLTAGPGSCKGCAVARFGCRCSRSMVVRSNRSPVAEDGLYAALLWGGATALLRRLLLRCVSTALLRGGRGVGQLLLHRLALIRRLQSSRVVTCSICSSWHRIWLHQDGFVTNLRRLMLAVRRGQHKAHHALAIVPEQGNLTQRQLSTGWDTVRAGKPMLARAAIRVDTVAGPAIAPVW